MIRFLRQVIGTVVLSQLLVSVGVSQSKDSSLVFPRTETSAATSDDHNHPRLGAIVSAGIGPFSTFDRDGHYHTELHPTLGFDFLAEPDGVLHFLLGGRLGFSDPLFAEASFGMRFPLHENSDRTLSVYTDLSLLFYADTNHAHPPGPGIRAALGARTSGELDLEYRLAGEWRGTKSTSVDGDRTRSLWWVGAEVSVAFSLVGASQLPTRKDSIRAAVQYIATPDEMEQLERVSSRARLDDWLEHFWKRRDPTPDTYLNEARLEYERRVALANESYSRPKRMGVTTDPGRVLVIYGKPSEIESVTSAADEQAEYQMWIYLRRIPAAPIAVFLFRTDMPRGWHQVYSNVPGELTGVYPSGLPERFNRWVQ
ncbi:MAG: GWxTD domain-containing protein [Bacteroidetes bacterium]|nr:GWxTD domain-containing protein [Bacteroidota bacterium]